jgi:hypothetical protein
MGVMRPMLSLFVVGSHVGGMGETPVGSAAIAGVDRMLGNLSYGVFLAHCLGTWRCTGSRSTSSRERDSLAFPT